jgi:sensor histidine kinase regulating citrate/malate metabolism
LQNLAEIRSAHPSVTAEVRLGETAGKPWLEVTDNGPAIPPDVATKIFSHPVSSENGLGIGLYQAARLALQSRYLLEVTENRDGRVQFRLAAIPQFS